MLLFFLSLVDSHSSISILVYPISNNNASNFEDIESSRVILEKSTNFRFFDSYFKQHQWCCLKCVTSTIIKRSFLRANLDILNYLNQD